MNYRRLGRTGLKVSELCLGTMQFGWTAHEATSFAIMDAFVEAGGNFITAPIIGANSVAQLNESLAAAGLRLSAEEMDALNQVSAWE